MGTDIDERKSAVAYRIAICDDSDVDATYVHGLVSQWSKARGVEADIETFPSAERFLTRYEARPDFDILLLDIEMGGPGNPHAMDGVELAKAVRRNGGRTTADRAHGIGEGPACPGGRVQIVFVTGYSDYIAEGYDVEALHYLMKPVDAGKLFAVLDRAAERLRQVGRCLNLQCAEGLVRVPVEDIRYIGVRGNYATVYADRAYVARRSLNELEHELDTGFFRVGRGLIVNLRRIRRVTRAAVELTDGTSLRLPRGAYEPLNRAIIERT